VVEALLRRCRPNHLAADLSRELATLETVVAEVRKTESDIRESEAWHRERMAALSLRLRDLRLRCPHPVSSTHVGDAQSGNDVECLVCGHRNS